MPWGFDQRKPIAKFNDKRNATKVKTLIILYHRLHTQRLTTGMTAHQLAYQSGVSYKYLKVRLVEWYRRMELVNRKDVEQKKGRSQTQYTISAAGEHYIEHVVPQFWLHKYITEIQAYRKKIGIHSDWDNGSKTTSSIAQQIQISNEMRGKLNNQYQEPPQ